MANKYDLLLVKTLSDEKKRHQPWYRERLNDKYIKPRKTRGKSDVLDGSQWTFLQKGGDDFRDGLPPDAFYNYVKRHDLGFGPTITRSQDDLEIKKPQKFTKTEAIYSKALPLQQQRRDHVDDIEYNLTQHPLAMYPHLEESLPPDVFEDVVEILDPEMNIESDTDEESVKESSHPSVVGSEKQPSERESQSAKSMDSGKQSILYEKEDKEIKAVYKWLPKQEEVQKEERHKASKKKPHSPSTDTQIQDVTREFCTWVAELGGESNNIEESTVMSLFASGYETKPALSVPIHVVELTNVPPELRVNTGSPTTKPNEARLSVNHVKDSRGAQKYTPSWVKVKYGAWYLNPKSWKSRLKDAPLEDPKEQQNKALSEAKKKSQKLDNVLATMHGAKAFKDFVNNKSTRLPEFLHSVEQQSSQQNQIANLLKEVTSKSPEMTEKRSPASIHTHS